MEADGLWKASLPTALGKRFAFPTAPTAPTTTASSGYVSYTTSADSTETTFFQLLCWYRVWVATQEQQRDRPGVAELADRVGFTSEGTCTRAYKKHLGMTPGQYRKHLIAARKHVNQVADLPEPRLGAGAAATEEDS